MLYNNTGHAETVKVIYEQNKLSLEDILQYYFRVIDPTSLKLNKVMIKEHNIEQVFTIPIHRIEKLF